MAARHRTVAVAVVAMCLLGLVALQRATTVWTAAAVVPVIEQDPTLAITTAAVRAAFLALRALCI